VVLIHQRHGQTDRRTDERTDDMRSQYRALHLSVSRGKNGKNDSESTARIPDNAEQIDVGIIDGEVNEDGASAAVDPQVVLEILDHVLQLPLRYWIMTYICP